MTGRSLRPGRKWLAGFLAAAAMVVWSVVVSGGAAAKDACSPERAEITSPTVPDTAAFGSGTIAYNRQRPDVSRAGIWVTDADGTDERRLADSGSRPVWSPDGNRIAYEEPASGEVLVMNADGTGRRLLTTGSNPAWSPGGDRIAYEEPDGDGVWVADADGTDERRLTTGWNPVWSPDGNRIAYSDGGIWTIEATGANPRLLANAGSDAAWSPDGRRIVYYESGPDRGVWVADADGGDRHWLVGGTDPAWSPDGQLVAYSDGGELYGIWVMDPDGANHRQLTRGGSSPQWSPDGTYITYLDLRRDEYVFDLWAVDLESGDRRRLALKGDYPAWSPDGRRVAYSRGVERIPEIWVADTAGHRMIADGSGPVWSADGNHIAYTRSDREGIGLWVMGVDSTGARPLARRGFGACLVPRRAQHCLRRGGRCSLGGGNGWRYWAPAHRRLAAECQLRRSGPGLVTGRRPHHLPQVGCRLRP